MYATQVGLINSYYYTNITNNNKTRESILKLTSITYVKAKYT